MIRLIFAFVFMATMAFAVEPDEALSDPILEDRARDISSNLRCVVCQNASIDGSHAGVARDLRLLVRERLLEGDTDDEVYEFVVARYGDYVLFKPFWKPTTYALWLTPLALVLFGSLFVFSIFRSSNRGPSEPNALTAEEEDQFQRLAKGRDDEDKQ